MEIKTLLKEYNEKLESLAKALETHSDTFFNDLTENNWHHDESDVRWEVVGETDSETYSEDYYGSGKWVGDYFLCMLNHGDIYLIFHNDNLQNEDYFE